MAKHANHKPRLNFTLATDKKTELDGWADEEGRSLANLLERIVLDALARKKLEIMDKAEKSGKRSSVRKI